MVVAASAGQATGSRGRRLPIRGSTPGQVLRGGTSRRVKDVASEFQVPISAVGLTEARTALLVPMSHRGEGIGVLVALDRGRDGAEFSADDERLLQTFAQSAANATAIKNGVEVERLRAAIAAADAERARWARELHDETLQALGGLRVLLASTLGRGDPAKKDEVVRQAIEHIELEIRNLREIIAELRPSLLDDMGLLPAIEALLDRRGNGTLRIERKLTLTTAGAESLSPELETTVHRIVQEALTNVVKHARAGAVLVSIRTANGEVVIEVEGDGVGFDVGTQSDGFGLAGIRERVTLAGGTLSVESGDAGTLLRARLSVQQADATLEP